MNEIQEFTLLSVPGCNVEISTDGEAIPIDLSELPARGRAIALLLEVGRQKPDSKILFWLKVENV
jgi:hypothetical protein